MEKNISVFYVTCPDLESARKISTVLLEEKLCACTNIIHGMESQYWWQGKLEKSLETILLIKTLSEKKVALQKRIRDLHSYETFCLMELPVGFIHEPYAQWLKSSIL